MENMCNLPHDHRGRGGSRHPDVIYHLPVWSHRGDREEADSLQERQQVLEDAHLLPGEEEEQCHAQNMSASPVCWDETSDG